MKRLLPGSMHRRVAFVSGGILALVLVFAGFAVDAAGGGAATWYVIAAIAVFAHTALLWWMMDRTMQPIRKLANVASEITADGLDTKIDPMPGNADFQELIDAFNRMLDRLRGNFLQATRFSADAAHELKTPLTILQGELENALSAAEPGSQEQRYYNSLLEEVMRLRNIVHKLLLLSQTDAGSLSLKTVQINFTEFMEMHWEDAEILAPHLHLESTFEPGITIEADNDFLAQIVDNMLGNAIRYNRPDGSIRAKLRVEAGYALLTVTNTGKAIPKEFTESIFERFFRGDPSRTARGGGAGLGLSLSRELARAHGGELWLRSNKPDAVSFGLRIPLPESG